MKFESIEELIKFAIGKELAASQFYFDLAETMTSEIAKELFMEMAKDEINHKQLLELEIMKLGKVIVEELPEIHRSQKDFFLESSLDKSLDIGDIIQLAIQKEQASFSMYMDLYALTDDDEQKQVIMAMAEEEIRHKIILEVQYNELLK
jgi:rubrerythrin